MANLLDLANQDDTQTLEATETSAITEIVETEPTNPLTAAPATIEEIATAPKAQVATALPGKAVTKPAPYKREEPPNPLLLDPYEWDVR